MSRPKPHSPPPDLAVGWLDTATLPPAVGSLQTGVLGTAGSQQSLTHILHFKRQKMTRSSECLEWHREASEAPDWLA